MEHSNSSTVAVRGTEERLTDHDVWDLCAQYLEANTRALDAHDAKERAADRIQPVEPFEVEQVYLRCIRKKEYGMAHAIAEAMQGIYGGWGIQSKMAWDLLNMKDS